MSLQQAAAFIQRICRETDLQQKISAMPACADLQRIVLLGAESGHDFTKEEFHKAFALDWAMRWRRYAGKSPTAAVSFRDPASV